SRDAQGSRELADVYNRHPEDWTATVAPDNVEVTVPPPAHAEPGASVDIPVKVPYPDGSTEEKPVQVTVTPNQAQVNTPG
ncbi:hypothetical protein DOS77_07545, partial [Staphylococcus felis]|uniref:YPDG domain-containing protein n=1 Tax=Staphylococcus felis TaxID=46127 RepID=UPI000E38FB37